MWWAQVSRLCRPQSWLGTNNTSKLVIPVMVAGPGRARSPSSIRGPLQNIYSLPCRWKDNSPLAHHRGVTKREWISPSMSQRIERGACTYIYIYIYIHEPQKKGVRITHQILLTSFKQNFSHLPRLFVLTLASKAPWQAPHRCNIATVLFFRIRIYEDDPILDDLIWLMIRASSIWRRLWGRLLFDAQL